MKRKPKRSNKRRTRWTVETLQTEALKYSQLSDFRINSEGAYKAYVRLGKPESIVQHMKPFRGYWTVDSATEEASKYQDRWTFQQGSGGAYRFLWKMGLLDSIFGTPHDVQTWNRESARSAAGICRNRSEFKIEFPGAYKFSYKNDLLEEFFGETLDTPICDNDILYIWGIKELNGVYKVGITSSRLNLRGIRHVERKSNLTVDKIWLHKTSDARFLESKIKSRFPQFTFNNKFSGSTEFIKLGKSELEKLISENGLHLVSQGELYGEPPKPSS